MPGVAALTPARFALGLNSDFRTTPSLNPLYSHSCRVCSDVTYLLAGFGFGIKSWTEGDELLKKTPRGGHINGDQKANFLS
jgi:hypothetical protein